MRMRDSVQVPSVSWLGRGSLQ